MSASVDIRTEIEKSILSIPIQAVTTREKGKKKETVETSLDDDLLEVVFLVKGDTVDMVEVKTGIQDDTYIQVLQGLNEEDEVVTAPYAAVARKLKKGDEVQVVKEDQLYKGSND